jgi:hypothetical protein
MLSLFNPWVLLSVILSIIGAYFYGHHAGYKECYDEAVAKVARANQEAHAKETELNAKVTTTTNELRKASNEAQTRIYKLSADVQSGALRLSIPLASNSVCPSDSTRVTNGDTNARTELDPKTSQDLINITADGDKAILALNACITTYNQVRETLKEKIDD